MNEVCKYDSYLHEGASVNCFRSLSPRRTEVAQGPWFEHACAYTLYTTRDIRVHTKRRLHVSQLPNLNWYETRFVVGPIIGLKKIELISGSTLQVKSSLILN